MPFYKRFFEISFDVMAVCTETHFLEVNDAMVKLLGYSRAELLGRSYFEFMHPDDVIASRNSVSAGCSTEFFENRYITRDGKTIWLRWAAHPDRDTDGAMHCVAKDITSEKTIANQLGKYVIDLQRSEREARVAKEEAETLAYAASHDLQEPLRTIMNWAVFLRDDYGHLLPDEGRVQLGYILENATRGRALVMDLLQLSRVGRESAFTDCDMNRIVDSAVTDVEFQVRETRAVITRDELPSVWGDPSMIRLLLKNLISNAMKFSRSGEAPRVHISFALTANGLTFSVKDEGIGLDPAYAQRVFGVFARLDTQRPGTGIGLAICAKIVKLHEGKIWIESTPGQGATVCFALGRRPSRDHDENPTHPAGGGPRTRREDAGARSQEHEDPVRSASRLGRVRGAAILAWGGGLRDRPSYRPSAPGSQPAEGLRARGSR